MYFSVIIPLFNKESSLEGCLRSVLNQTFEDFEIIVVNDGSTDGSNQVLCLFSESNKIKVIQQSNRGVSGARNTGISHSEGKYIAFLDADDLWEQNHLVELFRLIEEFPSCGLYSTGHMVKRANATILPDYDIYNNFFGKIEDIFDAFSRSLSCVNSSTACVSKANLSLIGGFPESAHSGEDVYVWLQAGLLGGLGFSSLRTSTYVQESRPVFLKKRAIQIPFFINWLDTIRNEKQFEQSRNNISRLLIHAVIRNSVGLQISAEKSTVSIFSELEIVRNSFFLRLFINVIRFLPPSLLTTMRVVRGFRYRG